MVGPSCICKQNLEENLYEKIEEIDTLRRNLGEMSYSTKCLLDEMS